VRPLRAAAGRSPREAAVNRLQALKGDRGFWLAVAVFQLLVLAVALRSPLLAVLMVLAIGVVTLLAPLLGTRRGTYRFAVLLIVTVLVLPGDLALRYRIPLGGGGIFIIDILLALLVFSWVLQILGERGVTIVRSPVTLPLTLFLVWTVAAALIGQQHGNDLKVILQDVRGIAYYVLFLWVVTSVMSRRQIHSLLRVLAWCLVAGFLIGVYFALKGQGQQIAFVEAGVSRFPAPNEVFPVSTALLASYVVAWPSGRRRPWYLWALLVLSVLGILLALVRGYWIGLAVGMLFLLLVSRVQQRIALVLGGGVVLAAVIAALAVVSPAMFDSVVTRTVAVGAYANDPSVQYRLIENRAVERQIAERPMLGNGLGTSYVFDFSRYGVAPFAKVYIHNNYLWFAQRMGLIGVGLFVWMIVAFMVSWRGLRARFDDGDPWLVGLVVGSRVMIVTILVVSISSPMFNSKGEVAVIALIMGMAEVAGSLLREDDEGGVSEEAPPSSSDSA
jgi:hypothetical protein